MEKESLVQRVTILMMNKGAKVPSFVVSVQRLLQLVLC